MNAPFIPSDALGVGSIPSRELSLPTCAPPVCQPQRPAKVIYARRSRDVLTGEPITFFSYDRQDRKPWGWAKRWLEEGDLYEGYAVQHVAEPSWRVREPIMPTQAQRKAA